MSHSIGFLGLGVMGGPMAGRLLAAGHQVTVYNRTAARTEALVALGARAAATPRAAAHEADVIIAMVTDGPDTQAVFLGSDGAASGARRGTLFVDMSTTSPEAARSIGDQLRGRGFSFLDAPVTGGDVGARGGTLSILVGGEVTDVERARPVFEAMGKRITHCGPTGAGQVVKACNQILSALNLIGVAEALHLARANGIDPALIPRALSAGAGGSWALENLGTRIVANDFKPAFMVNLMQKDLGIVQAMATACGLPLEGTALAQRYFADNQRHDEGELGTQAIWKVLDRAAHRRG